MRAKFLESDQGLLGRQAGRGKDIIFCVYQQVLLSLPAYKQVMVLVPGSTREVLNKEISGASRTKTGGMDRHTERL